MVVWKMVGLSDAGRVRRDNEDAIAWSAEQGWAVLADGMGGHLAGEVASAIAIEVIGGCLADLKATAVGAEESLRAAVEEANRLIYQRAHTELNYHGMGSTVVAVVVQGERLTCAHVGDSRLYHLHDGELTQLTCDHSLVQELVAEGMLSAEQARISPQRHIITRALGLASSVGVTLLQLEVKRGDSLLLCSDGLSDKLPEETIAALLATGSLPAAAQGLVDAANNRGGEDNISVIVLRGD